MQKTEVVSVNKIIMFVVFVSVALMTSLFIYHLRHQPQTTLNNEQAFIFPTPRDLNSFELTTADNQPFNEKNFYQHITLLFFGFTHCSSICPTTLAMMSKAYDKLVTQYPNLQVVLVSLDPERDTPQQLLKYVHQYNSHFIGVSGSIKELHKLQSQLGIYSAFDNSNKNTNYQIQHTSSILFINPQGKWAGIFKYGMNPNQFAQVFSHSIANG